MRITVLGAGAWGTALARLLNTPENHVTLWGHRAEQLLQKNSVPSAQPLNLQPDFQTSVNGAELIVIAVPSKAFREVATRLADFPGVIVSVTKGIEYDTGLTMSGILEETSPRARVGALSGPTLAPEVTRGVPTAIVAASKDAGAAQLIQKVFHRAAFRVYTSTDLLGVELGGALKNVIAIAAGVCDGLGFGDNSKAALVTRAIAEMRRLGIACGADANTFSGLSGLGDLTVTCFSRLSRNRTFGERLGKGASVEEILVSSTEVAEGYPTARSAHKLAQKLNVYGPIIAEVHAMLYEGKNASRAVLDLITRDSKAE